MTIDPRIDGNVKTAPVWAKALLAMLASLLGPAKVKAAIDDLDGSNEPDYSVRMHGRPLVAWLGINRKTMVDLGLTDDQIGEVQQALTERGRNASHLDKPKPVKVAKASKPDEGGDSTNGTTGQEATGGSEHAPKMVAGHLVKELAGKPYDELIKIEGIGAAKAKKLAAMEPGTEE